jgi:hypothetical protein
MTFSERMKPGGALRRAAQARTERSFSMSEKERNGQSSFRGASLDQQEGVRRRVLVG